MGILDRVKSALGNLPPIRDAANATGLRSQGASESVLPSNPSGVLSNPREPDKPTDRGGAVAQKPPPKANQKLEADNRSALPKYLKYPEDLGSDPFRHYMKITIYKNIHSQASELKAGANFNYRVQRGGVSVTPGDIGVAVGVANVLNNPQAVLGTAVLAEGITAVTDSPLDQYWENAKEQGKRFATGIVNSLGDIQNIEFSLARKTLKIENSINLYMPETLSMGDSHDYDSISVTDALGLAGIVANFAGGKADLLAKERILTFAQRAGGVGERAAESFIQSQGYAINPMLQIIYQGSKNREFEYTFKFAPRSKVEAETVINIIKTLRFHAAPEFIKNAGGSRYFIPPSEFEIEHWYLTPEGVDKPNDKLPRIAQCVLSNIDINYAASGSYATFEDGTPVEIDMRLRFTETLNLTKDDIGNGY